MKNYFDFTEKKYLVTGASSGIGRAVAVCLAEQGATVVLNGRNEERLAETERMMQGTGHMLLPLDLCEAEDMQDMFSQMVSDGRKLDGIVHCAGISITEPISALSKSKFDQTIHISVYALLNMIKFFSKKKYRNEGGSVVAISSWAATRPGKCQAAYAAAKAGMNAAIQSVAQELAGKGIRVNSVMPAFTKTEMYYEMIESLGQEAAGRLTGAQLLGVPEPEEIASAIMFLLSDASGMITGRAMYVDAGAL